jgi:hypothetical protein
MDSNKEVWRNINLDKIREDIILKYGSLSKCAYEMGVASQQLSRWLNKPSEKFYLLLIKIGILEGEGLQGKPKREFVMDELIKIIDEQKKIIEDQRRLLDGYSDVYEMIKEVRIKKVEKEKNGTKKQEK